MSPRITRTGALLLAALLLGSLLAGGVADAQQEPLKVAFRRSEPSPGKLKVTVAMSGTAWGSGQRLDQGAFTATINGKPVDITGASPLQEQQGSLGKVAVMLAVDTSGSMRVNQNILRAQAAADTFARKMKQGTRLGLIAFSTQPQVVQSLTTDRELVQNAIGSLNATGDTALYDAVVLASGLLDNEQGHHNLVLLSDGRDEGSRASREDAISAARKAGVTVYTVGLNVPGRAQDQQALKRLAERTGGAAVEVNNADDLVNQFSLIAQTLASQYVVDMRLPSGLGNQVNFRLEVTANGAVGVYEKADFALAGQASPTTLPAPVDLAPVPGLSRLESPQGRYVIAFAGFAAVLLACLLLFGPGSRSARPYRALRQRLSPYSLTPAIADTQPRMTAFGSSEWAG
jgi:VWFA-related protein